MTISILLADDGETVATIYNAPREGEEWIQLNRQLPQVEQANVAVTWYYRNGRLQFETEPTPDDDLL